MQLAVIGEAFDFLKDELALYTLEGGELIV